jgi:hypothetical protein
LEVVGDSLAMALIGERLNTTLATDVEALSTYAGGGA